ncbi:hypothetical protein FOA52_014705 [Chlamydomonas sp. UWO 241]|nr:hypothetical protein FOA52_014705 [Chlamydomonas sp. UWO 241]
MMMMFGYNPLLAVTRTVPKLQWDLEKQGSRPTKGQATSSHKLFSCSGCKAAYYCSKECQNEAWQNGGHKQLCQQQTAAKALMAEAGQADIFAAFGKWLKKAKVLLNFTATSALLDVGTSKIATHALMLGLDYDPSMLLQSKVQTFEVLTKAELATIQHEGGLPELSRWDLPGPDRRAVVWVMAGHMGQLLEFTLNAEKSARAMSAPPSTADAPEASPSCWSVRQLRDELARLGIDGRDCVEKRELVDLVVRHQEQSVLAAASSTPHGGQATVHAPGAEEPSSSGRSEPSAPPGSRICHNCYKRERSADGQKLFRCSGCKTVDYCSKECQNESWRNGGHREMCKRQALMAAGESEMYAAHHKWLRKMRHALDSIAVSAPLDVGTSRIETHVLLLILDHVPSLPLQFKVRTFGVRTRAELREQKGGLPELPPWSLPGPDRRALVLVKAGPMVQLAPFMVTAEDAAGIQSGRMQMTPAEDFVDRMNDPEVQT